MNDAATVVGVADAEDGECLDRLVGGLRAQDHLDVLVDTPATVVDTDPDLIVAVGEPTIADVVAAGPTAPIVPVDAGAGIGAVPVDAADALPPAIAAGAWEIETHRPLAVTVDGLPVETAVFDVTLVTTEAARISEYTVFVDDDRLDRSRADGVIVATPAGSTDYARRIEAPVLAPETGIVVAWIAPFRSDPDRWVARPSTLSVRVEREEAAVDLLVDGRVDRTVGPEDVVGLERGDPFAVAVFDVSRNRYV